MLDTLLYSGCFVLFVCSFAGGFYLLLQIYDTHIKRLEFMGKKKWTAVVKLGIVYSGSCIALVGIVFYILRSGLIGV